MAELRAAHPLGVRFKIGPPGSHLQGALVAGGLWQTQHDGQFLELARIQQVLLDHRHPASLLLLLVQIQFADLILTDDLDRRGEISMGEAPDSFEAIARHRYRFRSTSTTLPTVGADPHAGILGGFDGPHMAGGIGVAVGNSCGSRFASEHRRRLDLEVVHGFPCGLARMPLGFGLPHRNAGAADLDIGDRNRLALRDRQYRLQGAVDLSC